MKSTDRPIIEAGDYWRRSWPQYEILMQANGHDVAPQRDASPRREAGKGSDDAK